MGSSPGPIFANFFLAKLENIPFKAVVDKLDFYYRNVNDTFIIVDHNTETEEL